MASDFVSTCSDKLRTNLMDPAWESSSPLSIVLKIENCQLLTMSYSSTVSSEFELDMPKDQAV
jgi:hypothetical protein